MAYYRRIRELREDHDLTQRQVAAMLNMPQPQYFRYEQGYRDTRFEPRDAELSAGQDAPDFHDACLALEYPWTTNDYRAFDQARREGGFPYPDNRSQLLGWPDIIQSNMTLQCELVSRGYYLGGTWDGVPLEERDALRCPSVRDWQLLFQLDTVASGDFELMFGDCGRIYFYIRREDLQARRFDRVWLILQCF